MNFLDVLDSIGTGQRLVAPQAQDPPFATSGRSPNPSKPAPAKLNSISHRPPSNGISNGVSATPNATKRKIDDSFRTPSEKPRQPPPKHAHSSRLQETKLPVKPSSQSTLQTLPTRAVSQASSALPAKVPPKGSYAALMAEAKAAQEQKAKSQVGQIMHQATAKERPSKSERKRREEEEKGLKAKLGKQPQHNSKVEKRIQSVPKSRPESSYKGTAKPAPPMSSYKGTAGRPSQHRPSSDLKQKASKTLSKYDEYLGTDEEDEGVEIDADMGDGYESDASSDMEAGVLDVEDEENKALREAKADDAKELALESQLKREKEERRRRLEALAKKRR